MNMAILTAPNISLYNHRGEKNGVPISLFDFFEGVKSGPEWEKLTIELRQATGEKRDELKSKLPCATLSGTFEGDKTAASKTGDSGYIAIDFDHLKKDLPIIRPLLENDPYTLGCFLSCGGEGLCVAVRIHPERFLDAFFALENYYLTEYSLVIDPSCKNVNRLRYISHDPDLFINEDAKIWNTYLKKAERKQADFKPPVAIHTGNNFEHVFNQIIQRGIDLTPNYQQRLKICFALINEFGQEAWPYFDAICHNHIEYDEQKTARMFRSASGYGAQKVTIASFYYYAKLSGVDIMTPKVREAVSAATLHKRLHSDEKSTLDYLRQRGLDPDDEVISIVKQVFATSEDFPTDETLFDQLEGFIRAKYDLRRNEVTRYIEHDGVPLSDEGINSLYIAAAKTFDMQVNKAMCEALLHSHFVTNFHPIIEFFRENSYRKPVGVIDSLADTIKHDMSKTVTNYVHFFIKKWLIGFIGSAYGEQSPLVLVLTGEGNTGKTQWFRRLLPKQLRQYYAETKFDQGKDDEILMCKKMLLMNDEFGGNTVKESKKFKDLTDKAVFTVRRPYGKTHEDLARLAVLGGTSNDPHILNDPTTKNRRIIPINVLSIDHAAYNKIDKVDLFMEAYHAYQAGERVDLTNEQIGWLGQHTGRFVDISLERDLADKYFSIPTNIDDALLLSQGEIVEYLGQVSGIKTLKSKLLSQEMKLMGFPYADSVYYKPEKKAKRGFWLYKRSIGGSA